MKERYTHIASFAGNIGDLLNHRGFYCSFGIDEKDVFKIEMRKFYRNCKSGKLEFDAELAKEINKSKALILGGGGFFDIYWDESNTGTTLDMTKKFIDSIKVPVLVNAMGVHVDRAKDTAIEKFYHFITYVKNQSNWFLSIRNDGSRKRLKELYGNDILSKIMVVPDNGFMIKRITDDKMKIRLKSKRIGLSITNELFDLSFTQGVTNGQVNYEIAKLVAYLLDQNYCCIFFLHTPQDIIVVNRILKELGQEQFRNNIIIAPYLPFEVEGGLETFMEYYFMCDLVVGMRFHSNVISIANNIPIVGLAIHEQIFDLYEENGLGDYCVKIGEDNWSIELMQKISDILNVPESYKVRQNYIMKKIIEQNKHYVKEAVGFIEGLV